MKLLIRLFSLVALAGGMWLLTAGLQRWRLPYNETGSCFDLADGVVYHLQTAEVYTLLGASLLVVGLLSTAASFEMLRKGRSDEPA